MKAIHPRIDHGLRARSLLLVVTVLLTARSVLAADHSLEVAATAPVEALHPTIAALLSDSGVKVLRGANRTVCELWLCKEWRTEPGFKPSASILYPLQSGQLVGVARYPRKGEDFRGQEIPAGVYTLRYAQQPVDGNHVGTSDTLDFLLLLPAADDRNPEPLATEELFEFSAKTAGAKHPAMLSLLAATPQAAETPSLDHEEERDLWSVQFNAAIQGQPGKTLPVRLVVVGQAAE
jgi:hypothetical protein